MFFLQPMGVQLQRCLTDWLINWHIADKCIVFLIDICIVKNPIQIDFPINRIIDKGAKLLCYGILSGVQKLNLLKDILLCFRFMVII